jgi:NAD(P)-dependent dehydrogenase (short-subunit alcohol dehydrogenase family)
MRALDDRHLPRATSSSALPATRSSVVAAAGLVAAAIAIGAARTALRSRARGGFVLRNRAVLITGGARGLGLALARAFGDEGARVVLLSRSADELGRARRDLLSRGVDAGIAVCDVTDAADVRRAIREAAAEMGRLDVVVNNAGVIQMMPFESVTDDDFQESIGTHFWGPLHVIREALPYLEFTAGRIVNISSLGGRVAVPHLLPYCVGKFALTGLSEGLGAELAGRGIRVLTVTPGLMRTGSHRNVRVRGQHQAEARWFGLASATPLTSMDADRAARRIVRACREGRATLTPGVQAHAALGVKTAAPELFAALMRVAARILPGLSDDPAAREAQWSRDLDLGWSAALMPRGAARRFNQRRAADEG